MTKLIDGNPRWQDVEELALRFLMIHLSNEHDKPVDMMQSGINREANFCGTEACHAGWYAVYSDKKEVSSFTEGKKLIDAYLGFTETCYNDVDSNVQSWAESNEILWGNDSGFFMFSCHSPFGKEDDEIITLKDISDHWLGVASRLWEIQQ